MYHSKASSQLNRVTFKLVAKVCIQIVSSSAATVAEMNVGQM